MNSKIIDYIFYGVFVFLAFKIISSFSKTFGGDGGKREKDNAKKELAQTKTKPTFSDVQYDNLANVLQTAMFGMGTDEKSIYNTFEKLKNNADFLKLQIAFGNRRLEYTAATADLVSYLRSELNQKEIKKVNDILRKKGIQYSI